MIVNFGTFWYFGTFWSKRVSKLLHWDLFKWGIMSSLTKRQKVLELNFVGMVSNIQNKIKQKLVRGTILAVNNFKEYHQICYW